MFKDTLRKERGVDGDHDIVLLVNQHEHGLNAIGVVFDLEGGCVVPRVILQCCG